MSKFSMDHKAITQDKRTITQDKRTMMVLHCSPEQTDLQITIEASANFTALRFLYKVT